LVSAAGVAENVGAVSREFLGAAKAMTELLNRKTITNSTAKKLLFLITLFPPSILILV
jgi:hypothetical protein